MNLDKIEKIALGHVDILKPLEEIKHSGKHGLKIIADTMALIDLDKNTGTMLDRHMGSIIKRDLVRLKILLKSITGG